MDGLMLAPAAGRRITGGGLDATLKVAGGATALTSTFEMTVPAGYDVGAHIHAKGEELFYVLEGELDVLAFEPADRAPRDWHDWVSESGGRFLRGGPGTLLFVPATTPHAFANRSGRPVRMLFQSAPSGHEDYFEELAALLSAGAEREPDPGEIEELRRRHDIEQITPLHDR